jgi:hypothetical protein
MTSFDIKDKIDKFFYKVFNIISDFVFYFKFDLKHLLKKNRKYKNLHKNERCFILATGPSLSNLSDSAIEVLKNEVCMGVNSFYKVKSTSKIIPQYYFLLDNLYWEAWSSVFSDLKVLYGAECPTFVTDYRTKPFIFNNDKEFESIFLYTKKYPVDYIDAELDKNMFIGMNVVSTAILSAIYFGFTEIYLVGADYNAFCNRGRGHAYEDKEELSNVDYNLAFYLKFYWIGTEFHYLIYKYAKLKGVKVVNLNPESLLDAYPKSNINEVLNLK